MRRLVTFLLTALVAAPAMAAPKAMTVDQAMKASVDDRSLALARKTDLLSRSGDADGLARHLRELRTGQGLRDPARERLLHDAAMAAARLRPDGALESEVRTVGTLQSRVMVWTDDHGYRETRPLYDFAATARHVQRVWTEERGRAEAAELLPTGDPVIVPRYARAGQAERRGILSAFEQAPADQLAGLLPALQAAFDGGEPVDEIALAAALRAGDTGLLATVLATGNPEAALGAIEALLTPAWIDQAPGLLNIAADRADVGSAAVLALGRLAGRDADAAESLFAMLGGPHGASAAAALARMADARIEARLAKILRTSGDDLTRRHALLALRLAGSQPAREALAAFARDPSAPRELVAEVPAWLRD